MLPRRPFWKLPALQNKTFYDRLFPPLVTLWYLIFQRLHCDHTLQAVVANARTGGADSLRKGLSQKLRSTATTSYNDARQRLPLGFVIEALALQVAQILRRTPQALWRGMRVSLLDGSTVRMRPQGDIPQHFPPHGNQSQSPAYWCLMRVVVGFCAYSGVALRCVCASLRQSEQALACRLIQSVQSLCLWIGDRNFGVFRVVQAVRQFKAHALLRLTEARARKLLGRSLRLGQYSVCWGPTRHDQLHPDYSPQPIQGQLLVVRIQRRGFRTQTLYLFTTLPNSPEYPVEELVRLYGVRWQIEINLRYLKDQMALDQLECKSADMAQKEWFAGLMAYNLIRTAMLCAALVL